MEEDTEYKKLPVEERCVHKLWKARLNGYDELMKIFREIDDEKSNEWNKYINLIKKIVVDSHAMAQERGLEATLIFLENCAFAAKVAGDVLSGVVQKCIAAQKTKTKELAAQVALMFVEIDKQDVFIEELLKGMEHKNPKIVAACTATVTQALREFGHKIIGVKPFIKQILTLLSDRDKTVRTEGKNMTVEIYRWIGDAIKPQLSSLTPVILNELEVEFAKAKQEKAEPTRYPRSQQHKKKEVSAEADEEVANDDEDNAEDIDIDPMDLIDPVDILSKLPKDFYEKLEEKKWQDRKESLEALDILLQNPKLTAGDYSDVVKALKKVLTKDSNVVLVAMAGKCMAALARGLGKKFTPYALVCSGAVLEKFKEKKANVLSALRDAIDSIYPSTTLEAMQEDLLEALNNKNPAVKTETALFLARAFTKTLPAVFNKKLSKTLVAALLKTLNESDPGVRDASADALGTLSKLLGEKAIAPYLVDVDALKMVKIKESSEKAVIVVKIPVVKKVRPATAPPTKAAPTGSDAAKKPVKRPVTGNPVKKVVGKKPVSSAAGAGSMSKLANSNSSLPTERELTPEELDEKAAEILPQTLINELEDGNWKTRLSAVESFNSQLDSIEVKNGQSQILLRVLCKKPGLKDTNFQVIKNKLEIVKNVISTFGITTTTADLIINDVTEKLGDAKNSVGAVNALTAMAESMSLEYVVSKVISFAFEQKSPKVQSESLIWVSNSIKDFGLQANPKNFLDDLKKAVQSINPTVRQAAIQLLGTLYLYMGNSLTMHFDNEKPALKQQIQAEFEKNAGKKPPTPTKGKNKKSSSDDLAGATDNDNDNDGDNMDDDGGFENDVLPRVDILNLITEQLLAEMADKNWKTRNEGLNKLQTILNDAKLIQPNIGDLPQSLALRLVDSNAKIAQTALAICQQLAEVIGPSCKQYVRVLFPGFLNGLGDGKAFIRTASITCMNVWGDQCGYKEFFDGEMIAEASKTGSPALRTELWGWLADKLPNITPKSISKDELLACLPYLYANICDRSVDVRKNANEAVFGFMLHLGYEGMVKALERQKPTSKKDVMAALDKARPNLPIKPLPKSKQQAPIIEETKVVKSGTASKLQKSASATNAGKNAAAPASRKKEEEVDTSPMLATNNFKNQRLIDENKLKILKWSFTSPRDEFTELLRDQMTAANVNKGLMANMFHDDFRYHLKAIDSLLEDLPQNNKSLICNLDLVLKWISLRFYDTNPSVLLKGLEYLNLVFQMLIENEYLLAENEGNCFIPHLLIKIGDPKDAVRNGVRALFRQICLIYPFSKVFSYIMDGLKSKNARQRTECLDELGYLIETYGICVCQPSPAVALKEIAKHISDRDNSVRSAALNCVVQAYFLTGEKVYKLIGQLNEKDLSMLDERIKRASKTRKVVTAMPTASAVAPTSGKSNARPESIAIEEEECIPAQHASAANETFEEEKVSSPETNNVRTIEFMKPKPRVSGPFKLDEHVIAEIEKDWVRSDDLPKLEMPNLDYNFLYSPLKSAEINGISYPADRLKMLMSNTPIPHPPPSTNTTFIANSPQSSHQQTSRNMNFGNLANDLPKLDPNILRIIRAISSPDSITARAAINEINDILESADKQAALRDYEELYVDSICTQFKNLSKIPLSESLVMYQPVLASAYSFFTSKTLGKNIGIESLKKLMSLLLSLMADHKLSNGDDGQYTKVINGICLRILDRTNFTYLNCALIRLLKETCSGSGLPKFTDLLMKCIWRNVKVMPEKSHELDYAAILQEIHEFMSALPSAWWQQRPSDTPLRTVKTIIHNMAKIKGTDILHYSDAIPSQSELHAYLIKVLKNVQKENTNSNVMSNLIAPQRHNFTENKDNKAISKQTHEAMSQIFKLIADKETSNEGIMKLYEFKSQNRDVDIAPFLKGANAVFQKFIEDGLANIERSMGNNNTSSSAFTKRSIKTEPNTMTQDKLDPDYWIEKLKLLKNVSNNSNHSTIPLEHKKDVDKSNITKKTQQPSGFNREGFEPVSSNRLELLQQKLSQIKQDNYP